MLSDIGEEDIVRFGHLEQSQFDASHAVPHSGNGYEVIQDWAIHGSPGLRELRW